MEGLPASLAYDLGQRLRWARHRAGRTLADVAAQTGVSTSTLSRMELGRGGATPLGIWELVATDLGIDLLQATTEDLDTLAGALELLVAEGDWRLTAREAEYVWFDRPSRVNSWRPRPVRAAPRLVVGIVPLLTAPAVAFARLRDRLDETRRTGPPGAGIGGLLVVWRTSHNLRRAAPGDRRRSHGPWVAALRSPDGRIPMSHGLVWI